MKYLFTTLIFWPVCFFFMMTGYYFTGVLAGFIVMFSSLMAVHRIEFGTWKP